MSNNTEHNQFKPDGLSIDQELSQLIGAVMATKQSHVIHPAKAVLNALETNVETQAREMARHEIAAITAKMGWVEAGSSSSRC